jgi:hypothetical protein
VIEQHTCGRWRVTASHFSRGIAARVGDLVRYRDKSVSSIGVVVDIARDSLTDLRHDGSIDRITVLWSCDTLTEEPSVAVEVYDHTGKRGER